MSKYVAFLKAINVGGHVVKMDELRELFAGLKFSGVETFIASGNVIFETKSAPDRKLEQRIEKHLEAALGYEVGTFVRSMEEIRAIGKYEPFSSTGFVLNVGFPREPLSASTGCARSARAIRNSRRRNSKKRSAARRPGAT
jgi:uncharacterized protein (DUF1697 family)